MYLYYLYKNAKIWFPLPALDFCLCIQKGNIYDLTRFLLLRNFHRPFLIFQSFFYKNFGSLCFLLDVFFSTNQNHTYLQKTTLKNNTSSNKILYISSRNWHSFHYTFFSPTNNCCLYLHMLFFAELIFVRKKHQWFIS